MPECRLLFALALLLTILTIGGAPFASAKVPEDPRVRIVSPVEGQQFAPGDKVSVVVEIAASLKATDCSVGLSGLGSLDATHVPFNGTRFKDSFVIPDYLAGPLTLEPSALSGATVYGPKVTIKIRPRTPPKRLEIVQSTYDLFKPEERERIYVRGHYANGVERNLTSSEAGTTYVSSNPAVLSVDRNGECTAVGYGLAVVTIENGGVRDYAMFQVDDPKHPSPPIDLTDHVAIQRSSLRVEENPEIVYNIFQRVTITNTTALPLIGPLFLQVTGLPKGVLIYGDTIRLRLPDGRNLLPEQSTSAEFRFLNQGKAPIEYNARVYHGMPGASSRTPPLN